MKYVYYVTNLTLTAYRWQANTITDAVRFKNNSAGIQQLAEWVSQQTPYPSMILCDVIEEEFTQSQVPHTSGNNLKLILQRKLKQAFRDTPFRLYRRQKTEKKGKHKINVNFSAITNPDLFKELLRVLEKYQIPVSGIYSPASLCSALFRKMKCQSQYNLLVSQQDNHHMRLSFCESFELHSSRLSTTDYSANASYYQEIRNEADKNIRYLKRIQLLPQSESPDIYIIGEAGMEDYCHDAFKQQYQGNYHYLPIHTICKMTGLKNTIRANQTDMLYVHLLCTSSLTENYAPPAEKKYHYLNNTNKFFRAATVAGIMLALSSSIYNVMKGIELTAAYKEESKLRSVLLHQLSLAKKSIPTAQVSATEMQAFVKAEQQLLTLKINPIKIMTGASQILNSFNNIKINEFSWKLTDRLPGVRKNQNVTPMGVTTTLKYYQLITIKGHLKQFSGNYLSAQRHIRSLLKKMRNTGNFSQVLAVKMPVNISSTSSISGRSGSGHDIKKAEFTLILIKPAPRNKS
ncbi:hypothetical protein MNBD_GAMMA12-448 [hydrothermal vent metagenome]|uniref:GspL cytoplasmic actin-ATPase-like domain-containing protein n=1 Tax=hydrothermal vent metagenome TaxID=652676 RepID=A0A3B0YYH7_9ZZZZ